MAIKKPRSKAAKKTAAASAQSEAPEPVPEPMPRPKEKPFSLSAVPRPLRPKKAQAPPKPEPEVPAQEPAPAEPKDSAPQAEPEPPVTQAWPEPETSGEPPVPLALAGRGDSGGLMKAFAVLALLCAAVFLAYYFISLPENSFAAGAEVDAETFKGIFEDATTVFIVMDVRGAGNSATSNNILQCGVDFAASSGMGGKMVTPISFGPDGCIAPDGTHTSKECFAMLKNGITIYVKEGSGGAKYYANGMVVTVGPEYAVGTCGIKRL